jgi:transposase
MTFEFDYENVVATKVRRERLDAAIEQMADASQFTALVRRPDCLRGISTLTGFVLAVEIGDWHRFTGATIGSFAGLVPSEYSSGQSRMQGSITKTGNTHLRRLLVEAAWHHRARYHVAAVMRSRWDQATPEARARVDQGNRRVHERWVKFTGRRKRPTIANVAIARELAGWCWSLAVME